MKKWNHFIDGRLVAPSSGEYLEEIDPRTGSKIFEIARGTEADVDAAVGAASSALPDWRARRPAERARLLLEAAQIMRVHASALSEIERSETGKAVRTSADGVRGAIEYFQFYGSIIRSLSGEALDLGPEFHAYSRREPYGVVAVILPWNSPLNQAARSIAPALVAGNTVVAKPSEFTSVGLLEFARLAFEEAGIPAGVLNVVSGTGSEAGAALVHHREVRKVVFTGSVRGGREVARVCAERIIPVTLELGGKSPNIVFADCDFDRAVDGSVKAFTRNNGQVCSAGTRCLVEASIHDQFLEAMATAVTGLKIGPDEDAAIGPIITRDQYQKVSSYYDVAVQEGVHTVVGGRLPDDPRLQSGWFVMPTIYSGVRSDMRIAQEEIFGPVLSVLSFKDEDEAVQIANDTDYGLVAGVWTRDLSRAHRIAARLDAGQVYVNDWNVGGVEASFGGRKQSGYGREKGMEALYNYTQVKSVVIRL